MTRYIASTLFKDKDGLIMPFLFKYDSGKEWPEESFERVKRYIEDKKDVIYYAGRPYACYTDPFYSNAWPNIDDDYSFLFRSDKRKETNYVNNRPTQPIHNHSTR